MRMSEGWQIFLLSLTIFILTVSMMVWQTFWAEKKYRRANIFLLCGILLSGLYTLFLFYLFGWLPHLSDSLRSISGKELTLGTTAMVILVAVFQFFVAKMTSNAITESEELWKNVIDLEERIILQNRGKKHGRG